MLHADQMVGPYRIVSQIGQGGMATVYKAYHERLDRHVAIKVMHQAFLQDPTFRTRFEREARIIARLDHPHIVPVYDYAEVDGQPYLVMKHVQGRTLKQALLKRALSLDEILRIMTPLATALDYAHSMGVLHRDIKPSNIILDANDTPYLTDFGMARMAQTGESTISQDMMLGTPQYISPEQALGKTELDARTDVYSLGVVLYELIVGQVPFSGDTPYAIIHDHIYRTLPEPASINPDITPAVEAVLVRALAKNPAERFSSAGALVSALHAAVETSDQRALDPNRRDQAAGSLAKRHSSGETPPAPAIPAPIPKPAAEPAEKPKAKVEFSLDLGSEDVQSELRKAGEQVRSALSEAGAQVRSAFQGVDWSEVRTWAEEELSDESKRITVPVDEEDAIRQRVEKSIHTRNEFIGHLSAFVIVNSILWLIFALTSGIDLSSLFNLQNIDLGFPWPLMVTCFWGAGLLADAAETYFNTGERAAARDRAIRQGLRQQYGANWSGRITKTAYRAVHKRVDAQWKKRQEFFEHLGTYIGVNAGLWSIFLATGADGFPWPAMVSLFWGLGLLSDLAVTIGGGRRSNEAAVHREIERERQRLWDEEGEKPKREGGVRLTADGELTDSMIEELEAGEKPKRSRR